MAVLSCLCDSDQHDLYSAVRSAADANSSAKEPADSDGSQQQGPGRPVLSNQTAAGEAPHRPAKSLSPAAGALYHSSLSMLA